MARYTNIRKKMLSHETCWWTNLQGYYHIFLGKDASHVTEGGVTTKLSVSKTNYKMANISKIFDSTINNSNKNIMF